MLIRIAAQREDERQERCHQHAAADPEQPGRESGGSSEYEQSRDQRPIHQLPLAATFSRRVVM
jgi:hypothetical protein